MSEPSGTGQSVASTGRIRHPGRSVPQTRPTEWTDRPAKTALGTSEPISTFGILPRLQQIEVRLPRRRRSDQIHAIKACWRGDHFHTDGIILFLYTPRATTSVRHPTYENSQKLAFEETLANGCSCPGPRAETRCLLRIRPASVLPGRQRALLNSVGI